MPNGEVQPEILSYASQKLVNGHAAFHFLLKNSGYMLVDFKHGQIVVTGGYSLSGKDLAKELDRLYAPFGCED